MSRVLIYDIINQLEMSKELVSARGERAAIGGYLPQFDEFAWFVYLNLINKKLEWIRIADPKAEKLDDIQYATHHEIHAYQVKWTIAGANITYRNFSNLLPLITTSWQKLKADNPGRKVIPHLITNKSISRNDSLKNGGTQLGSFAVFFTEAWLKIKSNLSINDKWNSTINDLKKNSKLSESEFEEFIKCFDFQPGYEPKQFSITNIRYSKDEEDLYQISRFIIEKVASSKRVIEFKRHEIIKELGWEDRFRTIFNHELVFDRQKYQPLQSTIDLLNLKLTEHKNGYLFLKGGPGSGKSTLLNQWSRELSQRVIRYYAFDFINPSSSLNFQKRGNAIPLFFDLVLQLKGEGFYNRDILPYKDIFFLKEVFDEQLKGIYQDYVESGRPTIIIIDGLDHVPREYKITVNSFLQELPLPSSLPEGVYVILGSQSFELEDIQQEIQTEFQNGDRTIQIEPLTKEAVYKHIDSLDHPMELNSSQKQRVFEKSQGHPLYLSYLIERIIQVKSIDDVIESFDTIDGDIENYYKKIWNPIQNDENLVSFLGLMARITGSINLSFVNEWEFDRSVLLSFKKRARVLFNDTNKTLTFFHNSFRQFLLHYTSLNYLTNEFDSKRNISYHSRLAEYYKKSKVEKSWNQNHHLFEAKEYEKFVSEVTPDSFTTQFLNYRPVDEIKQDAKLGIKIALKTQDLNTLIKYLFALAETERRLFNIDPGSFTEQLLQLNEFDSARNYLRTGNILHCSEAYAFKACRLFINFGYKSEGAIFFNLAYPEIITDSGILIDDLHRFEEIRNTLEEWIYTATHFESIEDIFCRIENIRYLGDQNIYQLEEKQESLPIFLKTHLGYSLIRQNKWDDFNWVINEMDVSSTKERNSLFWLIEYGIEQCLDSNDNSRANEYLYLLKSHFKKDETESNFIIYIADLIYKVTGDVEETYSWIKNIEQPSLVGRSQLDYNESFEVFLPLIKFNKLLNLCDKGIPITVAIPSVERGTDKELLVEFERMLCLITQILADGILQKQVYEDITMRIYPIVRYFYKEISPKNSYWYKLIGFKGKYFHFLIYAVSGLDAKSLERLGDYLSKEFFENPKYWPTDVRRKIIKSLFKNGFDSKKAISQLKGLEKSMLGDQDISGRINQCLAHSKAWFLLDNLEEGEKWLKQAIQESIGVGYRKDYQFSTWIWWLRKINQKEPSRASERIKWFLSHLQHIKETTEGRAYWNASEELLEVTYEHNLRDGLEQAIWQIEHDLVDFKDSLSLFIRYFVLRTESEEEFKSIFLLYKSLFLLLDEGANTSLLKQILATGYKIFQDNFMEEYVSDILLAINTKAYEGARYSLLSEIESFFLSKEIRIVDYYSDFKTPEMNDKHNSSTSSNTLSLKKDYEKIDESEVLARVNNFDDFKNIIQEEDQANSFFNWSKVIEKIASLLTSNQIEEIVNIARLGRKESILFAKLSGVAFDLGDKELAAKLAYKSIELSSESGWVKYYDGGTRISAFNALRKINPKLSRHKAFEVFANDIISGNYSGTYVEHLEDIVPLLTENYKEEDLWPEIFGYLQRLMSNSKPTEGLPILASIKQPIIETLIDYLGYLIKSSVPLIKEQAIILLARYIDNNNEYSLAQLIKGKMDDYLSMDVIMTLKELDSSRILALKPKIREMALSKDFIIRENSKQILKVMGEPSPITNKIQLPSVYSLHIPAPNASKFKKDKESIFPEIDVDNPRELLRPFKSLIKILTEESNIEESNLIYRAHSIMKEIGTKDEWTNEYEINFRNHLKEINLDYSFPRPRVITARKAIMRVAAELIDSGKMDGTRIVDVFTAHDYAVSFFNELPKPAFIQTIKEREFGAVGKDWIERINESERLSESLLDYNENFKIIAEYSQIKNLDWGSPTEEYMCQIAIEEHVAEEEDFIFGSVFHRLSGDYHDIIDVGKFIVVIRDHRLDQFDLKSRWIAINPDLARYLGWKPEPAKLFAWKNRQGKLMAESIYWLNGNISLIPKKDGEVGEGWFVAVSMDGLEQIKAVEKNLFLQKKLTRSKFENSKLTNCYISNVTKL